MAQAESHLPPINVSVNHLKEKPLYLRLQEEFEEREKAEQLGFTTASQAASSHAPSVTPSGTNVSLAHLKEKPLYIRLQEEFEKRAKLDEEERKREYEEAVGRAKAISEQKRLASPPKFPPIRTGGHSHSHTPMSGNSHMSKLPATPPLPPIVPPKKPGLPAEARGKITPRAAPAPDTSAPPPYPPPKPPVPKVFKKASADAAAAPSKPAKAPAPPKKIDWKRITAKMPYDKTEPSKKKRAEFFKQMDPNGNGYLSLAEVDKGMESVLGLPEIYDTKPVLIRAFNAAKDMAGGNSTLGADFIEKGEEFRLLFVYLRLYFELYHMFDVIDTSDDRRMDLGEFKAALKEIKSWGLTVADPDAEFASMDTNGGGIILFDEFADWAIKHKLDLADDDDAALDAPAPDAAALAAKAKAAAKKQAAAKKAAPAKKAGAAPKKIDWNKITAKMPYDKSEASKKKRAEFFKQMDPNGNGYLSLAEVDKGMESVLGLPEVYDTKPVLIRAFNAAKDMAGGNSTLGADFIEKGEEFRLLFSYLRLYFELYHMFDVIDTSDDRRMDLGEFKAALNEIKAWGLTVADPEAEFASMDKNGGGIILFDEFADWAIKHKLDLADDDDAALDAPAPDAAAIAAKAAAAKKKAAAAKKAPPKKAAPAAKKVDWKAISAKLPIGETKEDKAQRKKIFKLMDPNGNGYLSLAEVDKGITSVLGIQDIFDCKPAIIRAFNAAKSSGVQTTKLSADFIELPEFRVLCVYLRLYFELFVMFDTVDTSDDRRVDAAEFKTALDTIKSWGMTVTDPDAEFAKLDTNGGGFILFNEFADWAIKHKLDLADDDDNVVTAPDPNSAYVITKANKANIFVVDHDNPEPAPEKKVDWAVIAAKLPTGDDAAAKEERAKLFSLFDPNGNGYLSLAEVDKGLKDTLGTEGLYDCKPAIIRAFNAAKESVKTKSDLGADYVEKNEFRNLLLYLRLYFELFQMFDVVDSSDDRRVDLAEFKASLAAIASWGLTVEDADAAFASIDVNGGGIVLFDEFADWAIRAKLDLTDDDN